VNEAKDLIAKVPAISFWNVSGLAATAQYRVEATWRNRGRFRYRKYVVDKLSLSNSREMFRNRRALNCGCIHGGITGCLFCCALFLFRSLFSTQRLLGRAFRPHAIAAFCLGCFDLLNGFVAHE
jgi:hypothetical protein